jgi:hypothetical protein
MLVEVIEIAPCFVGIVVARAVLVSMWFCIFGSVGPTSSFLDDMVAILHNCQCLLILLYSSMFFV